MKQKFSCFKFEENKTIDENLDGFLKLLSDLANININISEEDHAIQILYALPEVYYTLSDTLRYVVGKIVTLTIGDVTSAAYSKEIELKEKGLVGRSKPTSKGLFVRSGRTGKKNNGQCGNRAKSKNKRSKSRQINQSKVR